MNDSIKYNANFKVLDSTANSYTVKWSFDNFFMDSSLKNIGSFYTNSTAFSKVFEQHDISSITYLTDEFGTFEQIINWEDLSVQIRETLNKAEGILIEEVPDKKEELKELIQPVIELYSSKEGVEQLLLQELQYFHFPFGVEYDLEEPFEYETELPNMMGGDPISGEAKITVVEHDSEEFYCVLKEEATINPEETKNQIRLLFKKMGLSNSETKEFLDKAVLKIEDLNYYQYYYDPGVPHRVYGSRTMEIKLMETRVEHFEELEIELIYEED
jgi:hypothetical protein